MRAPCRWALLVCCVAVFAVFLPASPVGAATGYELTNGWFIEGATVRCPGTAPRTMSAKHAAAFIQAWYPATIFGTLTKGTPPASLPKCKFVATDTIRYQATSSSGQVTTKSGKWRFQALYASQGNKAWVGLPPQEVGPGAVVPKLAWFVATPRTTQAFHDKIDPIPNTPATTTTTAAPTVQKDTSSGSSSAPWIIVAVVAGVAVLGAGAVILRRRASTPTSTS